jgi:hypothetical protein
LPAPRQNGWGAGQAASGVGSRLAPVTAARSLSQVRDVRMPRRRLLPRRAFAPEAHTRRARGSAFPGGKRKTAGASLPPALRGWTTSCAFVRNRKRPVFGRRTVRVPSLPPAEGLWHGTFPLRDRAPRQAKQGRRGRLRAFYRAAPDRVRRIPSRQSAGAHPPHVRRTQARVPEGPTNETGSSMTRAHTYPDDSAPAVPLSLPSGSKAASPAPSGDQADSAGLIYYPIWF